MVRAKAIAWLVTIAGSADCWSHLDEVLAIEEEEHEAEREREGPDDSTGDSGRSSD